MQNIVSHFFANDVAYFSVNTSQNEKHPNRGAFRFGGATARTRPGSARRGRDSGNTGGHKPPTIDTPPVLCYNETNNTKGGGDMNKRAPRITSLIFQGAFSLVCILNIILCTIYRQNFDTDFGRRCADIALDLTFILFLFLLIALPTSLLLNIIARFPNDEPQKKRRLWKLWTVLSPAFYVILWCVSLGVFISSTGGV